jgi:hypothetical protein
MLEALFWMLVGAFFGWHVPQPQWAVVLKDKILGLFQPKT